MYGNCVYANDTYGNCVHVNDTYGNCVHANDMCGNAVHVNSARWDGAVYASYGADQYTEEIV